MIDKKTLKEILFIIKGIVKRALWSTWISKFMAFIIGTMSFISMFATITGKSLKDYDDNGTWLNKSWEWICSNGIIILVILLVILILRILWISATLLNEKKLLDSSVYTPSKLIKHMRLLDIAFNNLINEQTSIGEVLSHTCNKIQEMFDKLTGKRCCVSIKLLEQDQSEIKKLSIDEILGCNVQNIARDADHQKRDTEEYINTKHLIRQNTAYATIVGNLGKKTVFYLNNDVNIHNSYFTTSPYVDEDNKDTNPPYKSELVLPIYQSQGSDTYRFIGFLCIDCEDKCAFSKNDISFEIACMMASKLYWVFNKYYNHEKQ